MAYPKGRPRTPLEIARMRYGRARTEYTRLKAKHEKDLADYTKRIDALADDLRALGDEPGEWR